MVRFLLVVAVHLSFSDADLQPLVEQIINATLAQLQTDQAALGDKLAFTEPEAAALLSLKPHQLRDARLRGEITGCRVGKRILYERDELLRFLRRRRQL